MSLYSFNARNGLSVGINPTLVVDNLGNVTAGNVTVSGTLAGAGVVAKFAAPGPIGNVTASTGAFTTLSINTSAVLPTLSSAPTSTTGSLYFNTTTSQWQGYNGTAWATVGGAGATGGGTDAVFNENDAVATQNYTIGSGAYISGTSVTSNTFTLPSHNLVTDSKVHFNGTLPAGIVADTVYYVIAGGLTANTFTISATVGGTQLTGITNSSVNFGVGKIRNALLAGPFSIATGANITVPNGSTLTIV